ncbi:HET-domain-containing protein [Plenodomus tracheiphilus IPT5]|uniref:HET-domain-containing protein n=1 Tax=Plenodomus tracheiphilus IPT5 TaxID=1408161 RepID=A0A6A7BIN6_9PLEO|nr:HET-domain-containing protein [Plenodomus tracheiphilus IPT5]
MTFELANEWLSTCLNGSGPHALCKGRPQCRSKMPKRLLSIDGSSDNSFKLQLICTRDFDGGPDDQRLPYLTLSHRWGSSHILSLNSDTQMSFNSSLNFGDLPLVLQHAIEITFRLGYEYLWIDAMCIQQDSESDWQEESIIMSDIYSGSVCTIAALDAQGNSGGCFTTRNPLASTPCLFPRSTDQLYDPLSVVVQERAVASRTLFYGQGKIFWECLAIQKNDMPSFEASFHSQRNVKNWAADLQMPFSESLTQNMRDAYIVYSHGIPPELSRLELNCQQPTGLPHSEELIGFRETWKRLLQKYSTCQLTLPRDKLIAINGIIHKISTATGMHSIAGLWAELLPADLLWFTLGPKIGLVTYRAPSWSWAAVHSRIDHLLPIISVDLKWHLDTSAIRIHERSNGQVEHAKLHVSAPLKSGFTALPATPSKLLHSYVDALPIDETKQMYAMLVCHEGNQQADAQPLQITRLFDIGLILVQVDEAAQIYKRVGCFMDYSRDQLDAVFPDHVSLHKRNLNLV